MTIFTGCEPDDGNFTKSGGKLTGVVVTASVQSADDKKRWATRTSQSGVVLRKDTHPYRFP